MRTRRRWRALPRRRSPDLAQNERHCVVTTDKGNEFRTLERNVPWGVVHRQKRPDRNVTAVKDLAGEMPRRGGKWDDHVADATEACNARPHETVHAAPDNVETQSAIQFRALTEGRQTRLQQSRYEAAFSPKAVLTRRPAPAPVRQLRDFNRAPPAKKRGKGAEQGLRELN
ncbi:unnamed protein product [Symbiodinium pilosum]|uniref:Uncharacterized protein n=1 Tax=Symbiodinium pilosum TaxID=2952 RepID=A0A812QSN2_SYMPI|nr:unnamed protein product [Symbiodinium pilosum]